MARPKKDNADYHSHDSDMRNDKKIKALDLRGAGAFFAIRANVNEKSYPIFFYTTQTDNPATGTNDFKEYSIKVNYFPNKCDGLNIFLIMDGTSTGTVYFDDIQLLKYK